MTKNYLVITPYYPTPNARWSCVFVAHQVKELRKNYQGEIIVVNPNYPTDYVHEGIKVLGFKQCSRGRWLCPWLLNLINLLKFKKILKKNKIDLSHVEFVQAHLVPTAFYANYVKKINPKVLSLLQFHDPDPFGMLLGEGVLGIKKILYFLYHRQMVSKIDVLVSITNQVTQILREAPHQSMKIYYEPMLEAMKTLRFFKPLHFRGKIVRLHYGVDKTMFNREGDDTPDPHFFTLSCIGIFRDWKSQITLLKAAEKLKDAIPNLRLKFASIGPLLQSCKEYAKKNNINAVFLGAVEHAQLKSFYQTSDLFVLPSYFEGFGCVFTEAWSCGTPFITCEGQGMDDLILPEERHLWLCEPKNPDDLAQKILYYYQHRPVQHLASETDIEVLVPNFLKEIEKIKQERDCLNV